MDPRPALAPSFVAALAAPVAAQLAGAEAMHATEVALAAQWDAARQAWPELAVTPDRFARELARRIGPHETGAATLAAVDATRGSDVYLAIACCDGDEPAISRFDDLLGRELRQVAIKLRASADQTAELQAELRRLLLIDDGEREAALRDYAGRGDLRSYLRVMATRAMIRAINRGRREVIVDDGELFDRVLPHHNPQLGFLRAQYRETVDAALRAELAARLQIATDEVASIVRLVQSRVDMSLDRLLVPEVSS